MDSSGPTRQIVIPGESVGGRGLKPGPGTFSDGGQIYAAHLGVVDERDGLVSVVPLAGRYIPQPGDAVVGEIVDLGASHWLVDINSPYPAPLHATESPWHVEFGDTRRYLNVGDVLLCHVLSVDEANRVQLTMQDREARRVQGGQLLEIEPMKVPRVIGRPGSMISLIKEGARCGGYGGHEDTALAVRAIKLVEQRAQAVGLTELVKYFLSRARRGG